MTLEQIGVVGAGIMGSGIAQAFALHGLRVVMLDHRARGLERGMRAITASLANKRGRGQITPEMQQSTLTRLHTSTHLEELFDCDLVVEAVVEDLAIKTELFQRLDQVCGSETLLASNTSSLSITQLAAATQRPSRVAGMHFMNPAPSIPLVEIVQGLATDVWVCEALEGLARRLDKTPIRVQDRPGFVSNRVLMPMINEAIFALHEQVASAEAIDTQFTQGMRHPMGPLALADLIGLDTCLAILRALQEGFGDPKYRPCPLLVQMVAAGRLGQKSGRGFYAYPREADG